MLYQSVGPKNNPMANSLINDFSINSSANHASCPFTISIKPLEINGDDIGINNEIEPKILKGKFRLVDGCIYRVISDKPPTSNLLKLADQINLKNVPTNS